VHHGHPSATDADAVHAGAADASPVHHGHPRSANALPVRYGHPCAANALPVRDGHASAVHDADPSRAGDAAAVRPGDPGALQHARATDWCGEAEAEAKGEADAEAEASRTHAEAQEASPLRAWGSAFRISDLSKKVVSLPHPIHERVDLSSSTWTWTHRLSEKKARSNRQIKREKDKKRELHPETSHKKKAKTGAKETLQKKNHAVNTHNGFAISYSSPCSSERYFGYLARAT